MQDTNYKETNGIIIGPEFSRIFAEIILQSIDSKVYIELKKQGIYHKKDYELYRYVDDYFLFYNDDNKKDIIVELFRHSLKDFKLFINESKTKHLMRPIITDISIIKIKIIDLISSKIFKDIDMEVDSDTVYSKEIKTLQSTNLITNFKIIIKESNVEYKDILNYTFAILKNSITISKINDYKNVIELLEFIFFIYSVAPKITTTIKLCEFIIVIIKRSENFNKLEQQTIVKKIFDEIQHILSINQTRKYVQNETLYLLLLLERKEMFVHQKLTNGFLIRYFQLNSESRKQHNENIESLFNYFEIVVLLFYIKNDGQYAEIKEKIKGCIRAKFNNFSTNNTESVLLFFDLLSSPFLNNEFKNEIMDKAGIKNNKDKYLNFIKKQKNWFVQWENFDLAIELESKKSSETYG